MTPITKHRLSSGRLALKHIPCHVDDDDSAVTYEDLLIGTPVLRHLRVATNKLLEANFEASTRTTAAQSVSHRPRRAD